ncbi:MAG: hypothetical protein K5663_03225 [Clostridiales bacterium]|nr:hypothetical protein [Clostridiales bacterium]
MKKSVSRIIWAGVNLLAGVITLVMYLWIMDTMGSTFEWLERFYDVKWLYIAITALDAALLGIQFLPKHAASARKTAVKLIFALLGGLFIVLAALTWVASYPGYEGGSREIMFYLPLTVKDAVAGVMFLFAAAVMCFARTGRAKKALRRTALAAAGLLFVFMVGFYALNDSLVTMLTMLLAKLSMQGWLSYAAVLGIALLQSLPGILRLFSLRGLVK